MRYSFNHTMKANKTHRWISHTLTLIFMVSFLCASAQQADKKDRFKVAKIILRSNGRIKEANVTQTIWQRMEKSSAVVAKTSRSSHASLLYSVREITPSNFSIALQSSQSIKNVHVQLFDLYQGKVVQEKNIGDGMLMKREVCILFISTTTAAARRGL